MNTNLRKINQLIYHLSNILSNAVAVWQKFHSLIDVDAAFPLMNTYLLTAKISPLKTTYISPLEKISPREN